MRIDGKRGQGRGQAGASLMFALGVLLFTGMIIAAIVSFASTNQNTIATYDDVRESRYAGDGAIKAAINWAKDNPDVAVDPDYFGEDAQGDDSNELCVIPVEVDGETVTASCFTEPGEGSGLPTELGLVPDAALLLTGARHNESGPYSIAGCNSTVWTDIQDFFIRFVGGQPKWKGAPESSFLAQRVERAINIANITANCEPRERAMETMKISGPVIAAGKIAIPQGTLTVHGTRVGDEPLISARYGCSGTVQRMLPNSTVASGCNTWAEAVAAGYSDTDPGLKDPSGRSSINNTVEAYAPVGFARSTSGSNAGEVDGTVAPGSVLTNVRTTAYKYNPAYVDADTSVPRNLEPIATCVGLPASSAIIFIPGWYRDADVLNRYTAHPNCADRTIWFAPDAGPDRDLLTGDDETGPFYFDLTAAHYTGPASYDQGAGTVANRRGCGGLTNMIKTRWCIGGSDTAEPRVVVGTPKDWSPLVTAASGTGPGGDIPYGGSRVRVDLTKAETVDDVDESTWLQFLEFRPWSNLQSGASVLGDNNFATYRPCRVEFLGFTLYRCPSLGTRQVRVADFTPKATSAPVEDADTTTGRIAVTVEYGMNSSAASTLNRPALEVETTDDFGRTKFCGSYQLGDNPSFNWNPPLDGSNPMPKYTFTDAQQVELAATCGAREEINSYRMFFKVGGNRSNNGDPRIYFGGITINFDTYIGASFPYSPDVASDPAAKSDCDEGEPGGQFIFGGESHVYVADGSVEICGGAYPGGNAAASVHQVIGIYGVPQVKPLRVAGFQSPRSGGDGPSERGSWQASRLGIAEPDGVSWTDRVQQLGRGPNDEAWDFGTAQENKLVGLKFGKTCNFLGFGDCNPEWGIGNFNLQMEGYTPPTGYKVTKVEARVSWMNGRRYCLDAGWFAQLFGDCRSVADAIMTPDGSTIRMPFLSRRPAQLSGRPEVVLYEAGGVDRLTGGGHDWQTNLANGVNLTWQAQIPCVEVWPFDAQCIGQSIDALDGIELDITLASADDDLPMLIPQTGCITAHPNYSGGTGLPDCALVRADKWDPTSSSTTQLICWGNSCNDSQRGKWNGRLSVKGTIYAPSAAFEIDDEDIAYPLATRGAIMRHFRASGWGLRDGYAESAIANDLDDTPTPRSTVFTACKQSAAREAARVPCDAGEGDTILTKAGVTFVVPDEGSAADVPLVEWWADDRLTA